MPAAKKPDTTTIVESDTDGVVTTVVNQVAVPVETDEVDMIEMSILGQKFRVPANVADWPAEATDFMMEDRHHSAFKELLRPADLPRFKKLRLTNGQVGAVLVSYFNASGLGTAGE